MPPKKCDSEGNPFKVGWIYQYINHKLELLKINKDGNGGEFVLTEDYGSLQKGWLGNLTFQSGFKPLHPSSNLKNNKGAVMLLSKEF